MRFPSPFSQISPIARRLAPLALALVTLALGGACEDKHIGRLCDPGIPGGQGGMNGGGSTIGTISSPALECPSRICIVPSGDTGNMAGTGALCTASCESNDDCEGETGPKGNPDDKHCENGFVCMWPVMAGPFCGQRLCVCRDFVSEPPGGFKPPPAGVCTQ